MESNNDTPARGRVIRVPFHLDTKSYIKVQKRAKKNGCSLDEFLTSFFMDAGVDATPSAHVLARVGTS